MAFTVSELITELSKIKDAEKEVWISGNDGVICPCNISEIDDGKIA